MFMFFFSTFIDQTQLKRLAGLETGFNSSTKHIHQKCIHKLYNIQQLYFLETIGTNAASQHSLARTLRVFILDNKYSIKTPIRTVTSKHILLARPVTLIHLYGWNGPWGVKDDTRMTVVSMLLVFRNKDSYKYAATTLRFYFSYLHYPGTMT